MTHVIATAGHVDHGKSTLIRLLTGMEPDRLAEERRRGMSIELGFAWAALPSGQQIAFVDVPGHEQFVTTMLAGVGPVAAVMFVVAADEGWMPQSAEHLAALHALEVRHGLLVITRSDLADPGPAAEQARGEISSTTLAGIETVTVSGHTGQGLQHLRHALDRLVAAMPRPESTAPVRMWIDRSFTINGAGTVVTGTLGAGTLRPDDQLIIDDRQVTVRRLQTQGVTVDEIGPVARVAINLRGVAAGRLSRGAALLTPGHWFSTSLVDVELRGPPAPSLPSALTLHIGSAAVAVQVRPLGDQHARLALARPLPLHIGDQALLRDPGGHRVIAGITMADVRPPALRRRGAATTRGDQLASAGIPDGAVLLSWNGLMRRDELAAMGVLAPYEPVTRKWIADPTHWANLSQRLTALTADHAARHPLEPGIPAETARIALGLPDQELIRALVQPPLGLTEGRIAGAATTTLPHAVSAAVEQIRSELTDHPFHAPDVDRLAELELHGRALAAVVRAGLLIRIAEGIVLLPGADHTAAAILARLPQPFTVSDARKALDTTRRVAIPLLEHLDRQGHTRRNQAGQRVCDVSSTD
ncbi:MAG: selenocysteine-specific translation elongation factor [Actinomycetia bacterium]|nr:selenocysteine-specific translation elongation factor [Actinomycetes bacterium]